VNELAGPPDNHGAYHGILYAGRSAYPLIHQSGELARYRIDRYFRNQPVRHGENWRRGHDCHRGGYYKDRPLLLSRTCMGSHPLGEIGCFVRPEVVPSEVALEQATAIARAERDLWPVSDCVRSV